MNKTLKNIVAGILMVPMIALGASVLTPAPQTVGAVDDPVGSMQKGFDDIDASDTDESTLPAMFQTIINTALYIVGAVSVLMLIYGGIKYTTSGGNTNNVTAAKNTVLYSIVGIVVSISAYAIVQFVISRFE